MAEGTLSRRQVDWRHYAWTTLAVALTLTALVLVSSLYPKRFGATSTPGELDFAKGPSGWQCVPLRGTEIEVTVWIDSTWHGPTERQTLVPVLHYTETSHVWMICTDRVTGQQVTPSDAPQLYERFVEAAVADGRYQSLPGSGPTLPLGTTTRVHWLAFATPVAALLLLLACVWAWRNQVRACARFRRAHRTGGLCIACGYDLSGIEAHVCPECGHARGESDGAS